MVFLAFFFSSCSSKVEAVYEITNSTNQNKNSQINIEPNSKVILKTDMTKLPLVDGSYSLSFKFSDKLRNLNFGYFSNGYPAESITRINILNDTIIIKPEYERKY